jgi:hypothetical protein
MATPPRRKQSSAKTYQGFNYRSLQQKNSVDRAKLSPDQKTWLKQNNYCNVGWESVIHLYEKIADFQQQDELEKCSLEELFLEADRIGNKYQTATEIEEFQQAMAKEAEAIDQLIEEQFPQTAEIEMIDFSRSPGSSKKPRSRQGKVYRTTSV